MLGDIVTSLIKIGHMQAHTAGQPPHMHTSYHEYLLYAGASHCEASHSGGRRCSVESSRLSAGSRLVGAVQAATALEHTAIYNQP